MRLEIELPESIWKEVVATVTNDTGVEEFEVKEVVESDVYGWIVETYTTVWAR